MMGRHCLHRSLRSCCWKLTRVCLGCVHRSCEAKWALMTSVFEMVSARCGHCTHACMWMHTEADVNQFDVTLWQNSVHSLEKYVPDVPPWHDALCSH